MKPIFTLTALLLAIALPLWTVGHTDAQIEAKVVDQPPVGVESREPLKAFSTPERLSLFQEMLPHIRKANEDDLREAHKHLKSMSVEEILAYDPDAPQDPNKRGFVFTAGAFIVGIVIWVVKKIITAILWSILIAVILAWFKSYWYVPLVALVVYVLSTAGIARVVQRRA